jgi:hypothetical protein
MWNKRERLATENIEKKIRERGTTNSHEWTRIDKKLKGKSKKVKVQGKGVGHPTRVLISTCY